LEDARECEYDGFVNNCNGKEGLSSSECLERPTKSLADEQASSVKFKERSIGASQKKFIPQDQRP
jgi:hypothetical protein